MALPSLLQMFIISSPGGWAEETRSTTLCQCAERVTGGWKRLQGAPLPRVAYIPRAHTLETARAAIFNRRQRMMG